MGGIAARRLIVPVRAVPNLFTPLRWSLNDETNAPCVDVGLVGFW